MGYFQVRYDSRVVNYERRGFIRLATGGVTDQNMLAPSILNLLGEAGLYLVLGLVTSWWDHKTAYWRPASC